MPLGLRYSRKDFLCSGNIIYGPGSTIDGPGIFSASGKPHSRSQRQAKRPQERGSSLPGAKTLQHVPRDDPGSHKARLNVSSQEWVVELRKWVEKHSKAAFLETGWLVSRNKGTVRRSTGTVPRNTAMRSPKHLSSWNPTREIPGTDHWLWESFGWFLEPACSQGRCVAPPRTIVHTSFLRAYKRCE